ncbi:tail fiber protein [Muricauda sp. SCSIO 64092]|uniref:tail fiber protein n=1 Tax=Allomuricauda sp. SCSIO 64092 TaxID=2908842 RepID=UPI001FF6E1DF|nr:tail fiber protein [Muricauda sp. SCSIO 64092]UOY08494.1 tail fiber protein [Muricauda sp. SCSIO 64092]
MKNRIYIIYVVSLLGLPSYAQWTDNGNNLTTTDNVGIGTTNPTSKLQLMDGNSGLTLHANNVWEGIGFNRSARTGQILNTNKTAWQFTARDERFSLEGYNGATNSLLNVLKNGNVGIGTKNPDMKLTVKGNVHAEEMRIDLSVPAPDYVFKEDYKLRTIEEVEQFIIENHHLPEMPSAKDFEQHGVMQAEMDMNLLKKIEELTLYLIEQNKQNQSQKARIEQLEKELAALKKSNGITRDTMTNVSKYFREK